MTSVSEIKVLVDNYRVWLSDKTSVKFVHSDWVEITTPFLDRHNDFIQIYAKSEGEQYLLTDDGYTIKDLEISGCAINTPKRKNLLDMVVRGFAVECVDNELRVRTTKNNFSVRKHSLIQAILAVNDLFFTSSPIVKSLFKEDVESWLMQSEVRFLQNVSFPGRTGYVHRFDFAIPPSLAAPERIIRAINNPNKEAAESLCFSWLDTKDMRPADSQAIAILNDNDRLISSDVIDAMRQYQIEPILWSRRENVKPRFAA